VEWDGTCSVPPPDKGGCGGAPRRTSKRPRISLEEAYLQSDAGLELHSNFEKDGHVFGFILAEDPEALKDGIDNSDAQSEWDGPMDPILEDDEDIWLDEVYRMI